MGNGKITYTPLASRALTLNGSEYAAIDNDTAFNTGTGDFSLDGLVYLETTGDPIQFIAYKISADWASNNGYGYMLYVNMATMALVFAANDDGVTIAVATSNSSISLNAWTWVRADVDRSGYVRLYINGVESASLDISARAAGNFDNTENFVVGYDLKGKIGLLRFDKGRVMPSAWNLEEYYRLYYGYPRLARDWSALWTFGDTLTDLSANAYVLTHSGTAAYTTGWPTIYGYTFGINYSYGHRPTWIDADDLQRSIDGSLFAYSGPRKQQMTLDFTCYFQQVIAFQSIYASGYSFNFYEDVDGPLTFTARMSEPPDVRSKTWNLYDVGISLVET